MRNSSLKQTDKQDTKNNSCPKGVVCFNVAFFFIKLLFWGILFLSVILVLVLQLPHDLCNRILFYYFIFPLLFCVFSCFLLSDFFFRRWILFVFWLYVLVSIVIVFFMNL
jgi:hypothetical protein